MDEEAAPTLTFEAMLSTLGDELSTWVEGFVRALPSLAVATVIVVFAWLLSRVVAAVLARTLGQVSRNEQVNGLLTTIVRVSVVVAGFFVALGVLQLDKTVTSLLAGVGVMGLALAFAFQDIAANFISGLFMAIRTEFQNGDIIETNGVFGRVTDVTLRTTEIQRPTGEFVTIPNKEVFGNPLENFTKSGKRRIDLTVGVSYATDLARAMQVATAAVESLPGLLDDTQVEFFYDGFGSSSIDFKIRFWVDYKRQADYLNLRSAAVMSIKAAFDENDIVIPFPIRTLDFGIRGGQTLSQALRERDANDDSESS